MSPSQGQASPAGACCCFTVAIVTAGAHTLTAEAAPKQAAFLLASRLREEPLGLGSVLVFPTAFSFSTLSPFTASKPKVKQEQLIF